VERFVRLELDPLAAAETSFLSAAISALSS
jgi:hypothetical protein